MSVIKTLITGGAKSGKSAYALELAGGLSCRKFYVATARALDDEMKGCIEKHKKERTRDWTTIEEPLEIARVINDLDDPANMVIVDCLNLWTSNLLDKADEKRFEKLADELAASFAGFSGSIIGVTNEVGLGIVPADSQTRLFRNRLGKLNQVVAANCKSVALMVSGIPVYVKGGEN